LEAERRVVPVDELVDYLAEQCKRFHGDGRKALLEVDRMLNEALTEGETEGCGVRVYASPEPFRFVVEPL